MSDALLLVDVQRNMLLPPAPVLGAARVGARLGRLLEAARAAKVPVFHVRNCGPEGEPDEPGAAGWELVHEVRRGERVVDKGECDAFEGTALGELLPAGAELVVAGMQSEFCVRGTALGALRRGHRVALIRGAHATYDAAVPAAVEEELRAAGVLVADSARFEGGARPGE
ncbi:isochorismatase family protein [Streptomyces hoynatensis]|uniref:Isochorismatase family protein n=1 Tax=Streptomyces hoynatensis TaxID=1141874 RepID=A0A3A9YPH9_9ACTN|nr:isochorismatase family protein [Streptomyces hoynatensis]RKN37915.1 isochorismatase family protein [Streptomyces hoynatensis]